MVQILLSPLIISTLEHPTQPLFSYQCSSRTHRPIDSSIFEARREGLVLRSQGEFTYFRASRNRDRLSSVVCKKMDDAFYMKRCVELAKKAIGCTSPNPMVGCVIVKDGQIVGEGFHPKAGQPHAEVFALRDAGKLAENATAYVSLEPCNHYGRTPPCTEALINAKIKQVIIGMVDPNPIVASKGVEKLKASGIDVIVGLEEMLCQKLNEAYIHRMHTGKPFVTLRYSLSLDGRLLNHLGKGADEPGGYYSKLAQECDGIVVSGDFLSETSTPPTSLEPGANQPLQIIIARNMTSLHLPGAFSESSSRVVIVAEKCVRVEPKSEKVETVVLEQMNLNSVLDYCGRRGLCSVVLDVRDGAITGLVERGSFEEGLVQKAVMELCPVWSGGREASLPLFGMEQGRLKDVRVNARDDSVLVEGYFS